MIRHSCLEADRMAPNDVIAMKANFNDWKEKRFPHPQKGDNPFEYYCIEQFTRSYDLGDSQLKAGMIGGGGDGGIDAFYILANGEMIDAETEMDPKEAPEFKLLIVQVKSDEGFSPTAIDKLYWFTDDLLDLSKKKADYHSNYKDDLIAVMRLFKDKFGVVVGETPPISVEYIYVIQKDVDPNDDCLKSSTKVKDRCNYYFPHATPEFKFVNAHELWTQIQSRPPRKKTLKWESQPMSTDEGQIGLVKLIDYYAFIKEMDGSLAERFFDSNVRGYWPTSPINKKIAESLKDPNPIEFWLLNNGITILTEKIEAGTTSGFLQIEIHDPQVVNGLQTSRQIYNHFKANPFSPPMIMSSPPATDNRRVLVRVINTDNTKVRDDVIRCTNSQNEMPAEALRATDAIHRQLEQAFKTQGLFYDRRKGYYRDQKKPVEKIISVIDVLQAMLAVVLQRPDDARGRPRNYIKNTTQYNSVFGAEKYTLTLYLKATEVCRRVATFLEAKSLEAIHRRNLYFYLCMYATCVGTGNAYADPSKIQKLDIASMTDALLEDCFERVFKKYESLAEKHKDPDGSRNYDVLGRGPNLLAAMHSDLKRRLNPKKEKAPLIQ